MRSEAVQPFLRPRDPWAVYFGKLNAYLRTIEAEHRAAELQHQQRMWEIEEERAGQVQPTQPEGGIQPQVVEPQPQPAPQPQQLTPEQMVDAIVGNVQRNYVHPLKRVLKAIVHDERDGLFAQGMAKQMLDQRIADTLGSGLQDIEHAPDGVSKEVVDRVKTWYGEQMALAEDAYTRALFITDMRKIKTGITGRYSENDFVGDSLKDLAKGMGATKTVEENLKHIESVEDTYSPILPLVTKYTGERTAAQYNAGRKWALKDVQRLADLLAYRQGAGEQPLKLLGPGTQYRQLGPGKVEQPLLSTPESTLLGPGYLPKALGSGSDEQELISTAHENLREDYIFPLKLRLKSVVSLANSFPEELGSRQAKTLLDEETNDYLDQGLKDIGEATGAPTEVVNKVNDWYLDELGKTNGAYTRALFINQVKKIDPGIDRTYSENDFVDDYKAVLRSALSENKTVGDNLLALQKMHNSYLEFHPLVSPSTWSRVEDEFQKTRESVRKYQQDLVNVLAYGATKSEGTSDQKLLGPLTLQK